MNKKSLALIFSASFIFCPLFSVDFPDCSYSEAKVDSSYIFLIDFSTMICPICLNSIEGILENLKTKNQNKIIGIVVSDKSIPQSERNLRIINRQIKGFKIGNSFSFPIYIDFNGHFSSLAGNGAFLIELNNKTIIVIKKEFKSGKV